MFRYQELVERKIKEGELCLSFKEEVELENERNFYQMQDIKDLENRNPNNNVVRLEKVLRRGLRQ